MIDKPKRRIWQIHLSTAVILMFSSGGMLWINTYTSHSTKLLDWYRENDKPVRRDDYSKGWPCIWETWYTMNGERQPDVPIIISQMMLRNAETIRISAPKTPSGIVPLAVNFTVALGILCSVVLLCEWFIRRREAHKQ